MIQKLGKSVAAAVMVIALSCFVAPTQARADDRSHCQHTVEKAESRLNNAVRHHGERSRQAEERRRDLNAERQRCWEAHHQWWNAREHRWETEQNWDHR